MWEDMTRKSIDQIERPAADTFYRDRDVKGCGLASGGELMERTQILDLMSTLKLYGMRSAYDEVMGNGIKRKHEPHASSATSYSPR